jgi:hypothetical protein
MLRKRLRPGLSLRKPWRCSWTSQPAAEAIGTTCAGCQGRGGRTPCTSRPALTSEVHGRSAPSRSAPSQRATAAVRLQAEDARGLADLSDCLFAAKPGTSLQHAAAAGLREARTREQSELHRASKLHR